MEEYFGTHMKDYFPISLGYNCHPKKFIEILCEKDSRPYPRLPFDWIGSPMNSIYNLTINHFDSFMDYSKLIVRKRFSDKEIVYLTHIDYDIVFPHDFKDIHSINPEIVLKVKNDYIRRIDRFYSVLKSNVPLLFFRIEQEKKPRIDYGFVCEYEYLYTQKLSQYFKSQSIHFLIIYFTQAQRSSFDKDHNIIILNYCKEHEDDIVSAYHISAILKEQKDFLIECFKN